MILENLPKITRIEGGTGTIESEEFRLGNYRVAAFLFENIEGNTLTVKVKGNTEGGTAETVPFLFKATDGTVYEEVETTGKTVTRGGAFVAVVTADSLSHKEFDRVKVTLECDADLTPVYALQTQPRYEGDE